MKKYISLILYSVLISIILSCKKETKINTTIPIITTLIDSTTISTNGAVLNGIITSNGGSAILEKGICWDTLPNPTIDDFVAKNIENKDTFQCNVIPLQSSTVYYARAYAKNINGIAYGNEISFQTNFSCGDVIKDVDGNIYHTVNIGGQCWTVENLTTSKYNDGTTINTSLSNAQWQSTTTGAYAIYNDDATNNTTYGKLYNWYAVNSGKLAPKGWHIPSNTEWDNLIIFLGGENIAGGKMKSITSIWKLPNTGASNSYGFSGLPSGVRYLTGEYVDIAYQSRWWSSSEVNSIASEVRSVNYNSSKAYNSQDNKQTGCSIRCIKD